MADVIPETPLADPVAKFAFLALHASLNEHIKAITATDDWRTDGTAAHAVGKALARAHYHAFAGITPPEVDPEAPFSFPQAQFKSV